MHVHILGIGGTFMAGIALLASEQGHRVTGYDTALYPPMSTLLHQQGIAVSDEAIPHESIAKADCWIIGNVFSRGHPAVEWALDRGVRCVSGPAWLAEHVLHGRRVIAVSGTHGKTTTTAMVAWCLEHAGMQPGFLLGGMTPHFSVSARLGDSPWFVLESDEYDSAYFDKRPKFMHYRPDVLLINNLEFDHADIYEDLAAIEKQFAWLLRNVVPRGWVVYPEGDAAIERVLSNGCWSQKIPVNGQLNDPWSVHALSQSGDCFQLTCDGQKSAPIKWSQWGQHSLNNALMASVACVYAGCSVKQIAAGLREFKGVMRRLQHLGECSGVQLYDDFAHHPTAVMATLSALRAKLGPKAIKVVFQFASNSMRQGVHNAALQGAFTDATKVYCLSDGEWDDQAWVSGVTVPAVLRRDTADLLRLVAAEAQSGDHVVLMTNKNSQLLFDHLSEALKQSS
jgi:UDP-N-acetylmuramate: L-alanyl-gamma-D-glutamyl-meso-diaminopimelate ligase